MTNVDDAKRDAKFKAACEEYIREAMADGLNREQVLARLEEMAKIAFWRLHHRSSLFVQSSPWWKTKRGTLTEARPLLFGGLFLCPPSLAIAAGRGLAKFVRSKIATRIATQLGDTR